MAERLFSTYQTADLLGTTHNEVVGWIEKGWLPFKRLPGGPLRISETHLVKFLKARGVDLGQIMTHLGESQPLPAWSREMPVDNAGQASVAAPAEAAARSAEVGALKDVVAEAVALIEPADSEQTSPGLSVEEEPALTASVEIPSPETVQEDMESAEVVEQPVESHETPIATDTFNVEASDPAQQVTEAMLADALSVRATHIHLRLRGGELSLALRINGALENRPRFRRLLPAGLAEQLVAYLKTSAGLDLTSQAMQSGRLVMDMEAGTAAFDITSCRTVDGERIVLKAVERTWAGGLDSLGLPDREAHTLRSLLREPSGLVLVGGAAGSGRGDLLRAMLTEMDNLGRDRVGILTGRGATVQGVSYCHLSDTGRFASGDAVGSLAALDGEVIFAENLDGSALPMAVEAALDGRLVLASLMTRSADETMEMVTRAAGPWPLASAMLAMVQMQSVRALCSACKRTGELPETLARDAKDLATVYVPAGCEKCGRSGYAGRLAVPVTCRLTGEPARRLREGGDAEGVLDALVEAMRYAGFDRLRAGLTSPTELEALLGL